MTSALIAAVGVVISALLGALFGWFAARMQAAALVKSGREQAIETEKLRLEFSLPEQRLRLFFTRAEGLATVVPDVPHSLEAAVTFFTKPVTTLAGGGADT